MLKDAAIQNVPPSVAAAINSATSSSELREQMLTAMEKEGMVLPRSRTDEFNIRYNPEAIDRPVVQPLSAGRPAPEPSCVRVIYPSGNSRFEIYGNSEAELDAQERQLRAMYGGQHKD